MYTEEEGNKVCLRCDFDSGLEEQIDNTEGGIGISCMSPADGELAGFKKIPQYAFNVKRRRIRIRECIEGRNYDDGAFACLSYNSKSPKHLQ